jgi:subfamily B ATP-binding cassette protein MsbA
MFDTGSPQWLTARRLMSYFRPHLGSLYVAMAAFTLASMTEPVIPRLLKIALDEGFIAEPTFPLWAVPVALIGLFALRGLFGFLGTYMLNRCTSRAVLGLRSDLAAVLLRADSGVLAHTTPSVISAKVINDPQFIASSLGGALITLLRDGTTALALFIYLLYINWQLTLLSLTALPLLFWGVRKVQRRIMVVGTAAYRAQVDLVSVTDDLARAWRVIRTFDAGGFELARFDRGAREVQRTSLKNVAASAMMTPISQIATSVGVALIVTLALYQAQAGTSTAGAFVEFVAALLLLVSRTRHLADVSQPILQSIVVTRGCFELLDMPPEPDTGTLTMDRARGDIRFEDVRVSYPGSERPALDGLSMHARPGTIIALVGSSGAGKSTVVNTLLGFTAVDSGQVQLDGVDVASLRKSELRRQFAVVSQDIVLFDGSVADNVRYSKPADLQKIEACLRAAALWEFVAGLPEGMDTQIGVNGSKLSGGQRQRLAIARALYKDAPVWILDEATSALDTESERAIQQALAQWHGSKTIVVIAHRLSTIRDADAIYVLDNGRVSEAGSHAELMMRAGRYAAMVEAQRPA